VSKRLGLATTLSCLAAFSPVLGLYKGRQTRPYVEGLLKGRPAFHKCERNTNLCYIVRSQRERERDSIAQQRAVAPWIPDQHWIGAIRDATLESYHTSHKIASITIVLELIWKICQRAKCRARWLRHFFFTGEMHKCHKTSFYGVLREELYIVTLLAKRVFLARRRVTLYTFSIRCAALRVAWCLF
jgi:hypothetical protein